MGSQPGIFYCNEQGRGRKRGATAGAAMGGFEEKLAEKVSMVLRENRKGISVFRGKS